MSEEKFRSICDLAQDAILLMDNQGNISYWNNAAEKIFGYSAQEALGKKLHTFLVPQRYEAAHKRGFGKFKMTGQGPAIGKTLEFEATRKDGSEIPIELSISAIKLKGEWNTIGIIRNITEGKRAADMLRKSEEKYRLLFESMMDGFALHEIVLNKKGKLVNYVFLEVNSAFEQLTDLKRKNLIGKKVTEVLPGIEKDPADWIGKYGKVALTGQEIRFEQYAQSLDKWYSVLAFSPQKDQFATIFKDITEHKRLEEVLRAERDKAQNFLDVAGVMFVAINNSGEVTMINQKGCQILGYPEEEIIGKNWFDNFMPDRFRTEVKQVSEKILRGEIEAAEYFENPVLMKSGKERIIAWHNTILKDVEGNILGHLSSGEDITERKSAEEKLRESEEKFYKAFHNNPDSLYITTIPEGKFVNVNPAFEKISGYNKEEVLGKTALELDFYINPDDRKKLFQRLQKDGRLHDYAISFRIKSGEIRLCRVFSEVIEIQRKSHLLSIIRDITEQKKAEDELRGSAERMKILFEYAPDAYYLSDLKGNFIDGNIAAEDMLGYKRSELIGKSFLKLKLLSAKEIYKAGKLLTKNVLGKGTGPDEFTITRKDSTKVIIEIRTYPVKIKGRTLVLGIARDITERKITADKLSKAYEELKKTQQELVQSEKMAALGRFSSGVAHEIRNPLGIILVGMEFLERKLSKIDVDVKEPIEKIKDATFRADAIVQSLLKYARPSELKTERIKTEDLIEETLSLIKHRSSLHNIKIETHFAREELYIDVDKNQMEQVLVNTLINAIEAMPKGGVIKIKAYKTTPSKYSQAKPKCVIEITDTGEGISKDNLTMLFEPFFTTKRDKKGIGLGMFMSKMIVINHNGDIIINSKVGKGTKVNIFLPIASEGVKDNEKK